MKRFVSCAIAALVLAACSKTSDSVTLTRATATLTTGKTLQLALLATSAVNWTVAEGAAGGTIDSTGLYTAPAMAGTYHVTAALQANASLKATATLTVVAAAPRPVVTASATATPGQTGLAASVPAAPGMTYSWRVVGGTLTGGGTAAQISFTAGDPGELIVACTLTNAAGDSGPEGIAAVAIATIPIPDPPVIVTHSPVTSGDSTLNATVVAPNASLTYAWTIANGTITSGAASGAIVFTAGEAGDTILSVTAHNSSGTSAPGTADVTVFLAPAVPLISAPTIVTQFRSHLKAKVASVPSSTHAWTITGGTIDSGAASDSISFTAGSGLTVVLSAVETNGAGLTGTAGTASIALRSTGIELVAGGLGGSGNIDGVGAAARLNYPYDVKVNAAGLAYTVDAFEGTLRTVAPDGTVTTIAGGPAGALSNPTAVAVGPAGSVFVAAARGDSIVQVESDGGVATLFPAGSSGDVDGPVGTAKIGYVSGLRYDTAGNRLLFTDGVFSKVRTLSINPDGGYRSTTFATGIPGALGVGQRADGGVYAAASGSDQIVSAAPNPQDGGAGVAVAVAGVANTGGYVNGPGAIAKFSLPSGLDIDPATGNIYVADLGNRSIRTVGSDGGSWNVSTLVPPGRRYDLSSVGYDGTTGDVLGARSSSNVVTRYHSDGGTIDIGAQQQTGTADGVTGAARFSFQGEFGGVAFDSNNNAFVLDPYNATVRSLSFDNNGVATSTTVFGNADAGFVDGLLHDAQISNSGGGLSFDPIAGINGTPGVLWIADLGNNNIRAMMYDATGTLVLVTPAGNPTNACQDPGLSDGTGPSASFCGPTGIVADPAGSGNVFVADTGSATIRLLQDDGKGDGFAKVTTIAGGFCGLVSAGSTRGGAAIPTDGFCQPTGIAMDLKGNVFETDNILNIVRELTPHASTIAGGAPIYTPTTIAGLANHACTSVDGTMDVSGATTTRTIGLCLPVGVAVDAAGNVYVSEYSSQDGNGSTIRKLTPTVASGVTTGWTSTTVAGIPGHRGVSLGGLPGTLNGPGLLTMTPTGDLLMQDEVENSMILIRVPEVAPTFSAAAAATASR